MIPTLLFLSLIPFLQVNATQPILVSPPQQQIPLSQIPQQVQSNTNTLETTVTGLTLTAAGLIGKTVYDRRNNGKVNETGSEIDKILLNDVIDNYNDFREYANMDKMILDQAMLHPDFSYSQLVNLVYDVSTKETIGQRKARYVEKINEYYKQYYQNSTITSSTKNTLENTLNYVKDKTTPA